MEAYIFERPAPKGWDTGARNTGIYVYGSGVDFDHWLWLVLVMTLSIGLSNSSLLFALHYACYCFLQSLSVSSSTALVAHAFNNLSCYYIVSDILYLSLYGRLCLILAGAYYSMRCTSVSWCRSTGNKSSMIIQCIILCWVIFLHRHGCWLYYWLVSAMLQTRKHQSLVLN